MKELTTVLNVQFTYVRKYDDETADKALLVQDEAAENWVKAIGEYSEADDIQLLDRKTFVLDKEDSCEG